MKQILRQTFQDASDLIIEVYDATRRFPEKEKFFLTLKLRLAAISVAARISKCEQSAVKEQKISQAALCSAIEPLHKVKKCILEACSSGFLLQKEGARIICEYEKIEHNLAHLRKLALN